MLHFRIAGLGRVWLAPYQIVSSPGLIHHGSHIYVPVACCLAWNHFILDTQPLRTSHRDRYPHISHFSFHHPAFSHVLAFLASYSSLRFLRFILIARMRRFGWEHTHPVPSLWRSYPRLLSWLLSKLASFHFLGLQNRRTSPRKSFFMPRSCITCSGFALRTG
jgi:hypothetical protein